MVEGRNERGIIFCFTHLYGFTDDQAEFLLPMPTHSYPRTRPGGIGGGHFVLYMVAVELHTQSAGAAYNLR